MSELNPNQQVMRDNLLAISSQLEPKYEGFDKFTPMQVIAGIDVEMDKLAVLNSFGLNKLKQTISILEDTHLENMVGKEEIIDPKVLKVLSVLKHFIPNEKPIVLLKDFHQLLKNL